jgi:hypothetical protein
MKTGSVFLTILIIAALVCMVLKTARPYFQYRKAKDITKRWGRIEGKVGEENRRIGGREFAFAYPLYAITVGRKTRHIQGTVAHLEVKVGEKIEMFCDDETGGAWAARDIPLLKKQIKLRVIVVGIVAAVMVAISAFLQ